MIRKMPFRFPPTFGIAIAIACVIIFMVLVFSPKAYYAASSPFWQANIDQFVVDYPDANEGINPNSTCGKMRRLMVSQDMFGVPGSLVTREMGDICLVQLDKMYAVAIHPNSAQIFQAEPKWDYLFGENIVYQVLSPREFLSLLLSGGQSFQFKGELKYPGYQAYEGPEEKTIEAALEFAGFDMTLWPKAWITLPPRPAILKE